MKHGITFPKTGGMAVDFGAKRFVPLLALLPLFLLTTCQHGPAPLTAEVPLHLEDHLDAAVITGSEVPSDVPEAVEWRFGEAQPDWKPAQPLQKSVAPLRVSRTADSLALHLGEENDFKDRRWTNLIGAVYVELTDWSLDDWDDIPVAYPFFASLEFRYRLPASS